MGRTDLSRTKRKLQEVDEATTGDFFKAGQGDNLIRILPPWGSAEWPFKEVEEHTYPGKEYDERFTCPISIGEKYCYTCDTFVPYVREGDKNDQEIAANLAAGRRVYANIIDRNHSERGVQIWSFSFFRTYKMILAIFNDPDYGDITDLERGTDLVLTRSGTGLETKYPSLLPKRTRSIVDPGSLRGLFDLDLKFRAPTAERQRELLYTAFNVQLEIPEKFRGASSGAPTPAQSTAPAAPNDEVPFDIPFVQTQPVSQAVPERSGQRIAILIPDDVAGPKRKVALAKAIATSPCFSKLLDENSDVCVQCSALIDCAKAMVEVEQAHPAPVQQQVAAPIQQQVAAQPQSITGGSRTRAPQRK